MKPCPVCGGADARPLFEKNGFLVCDCRGCGAAFAPNPPSPKAFKEHYSLDYFRGNRSKFGYIDYAAEGPFQAESFRRKARHLAGALRGGRILDAGCATSSFLEQLGPEWEKYGCDISEELLQAYPPPREMRVWTGDFLEYPETGKPFDAVTLWDVLDHVPDPGAALDKASRLLRHGGIIGINAGDRSSLFARCLGKRWHLYIPPTHLTFFTRDSLLRLLEARGFHAQSWEYEGRWAPLSLCFFRLSYIIPRAWTRRLYEWSLNSALRDWKIYVNLRDVVTVYAVKS